MGGEYPKGGGRYSWGIRPSGGGAIFLGYSSPGGGIPRNIAPFWEGGESPGGDKSQRHGQKSILPPPKKNYEFAQNMSGAATAWRSEPTEFCILYKKLVSSQIEINSRANKNSFMGNLASQGLSVIKTLAGLRGCFMRGLPSGLAYKLVYGFERTLIILLSTYFCT